MKEGWWHTAHRRLRQTFLATDRGVQTTSGQLAGAVSTAVVYPLDTIRFRYMSQDGTLLRRHNGGVRYTGVVSAMRLIVRDEGVQALFRGVGVAVGGSAYTWGAYFYLYRTYQLAIAPFAQLEGQGASMVSQFVARFGTDTLCSTSASVSAAVLTTPIWLIKTRMQVEDVRLRDVAKCDGTPPPRCYRNFRTGVLHAVRSDGPLSLWRGLNTQLLMAIPNGVNIPLYEAMKRWYLATRRSPSAAEGGSAPSEERRVAALPFAAIVIFSSLSRGCIAVLTNPLFVIRTRLQDMRSRSDHTGGVAPTYVNTFDVLRHIRRTEGCSALFRGLSASLMLTIPRTCLYMILLEYFTEALSAQR